METDIVVMHLVPFEYAEPDIRAHHIVSAVVCNGDNALQKAIDECGEETVFVEQMMDLLDIFYPTDDEHIASQCFLVNYQVGPLAIVRVTPLSDKAIDTMRDWVVEGADLDEEFVLWE